MVDARSERKLRPVARRTDDWLVGGGEMGGLVRSMDWSTTPLGAIESWPQSLRTTVSLVLASNFPIALAWGPNHTQIYNDGYWPICGGKHPHSMGQDFSECWASAWPVIGVAFERALAGETSYLKDQRMFLDRNGYLEETFFTFSFSPIRDETGGVGGLFHPVNETTANMVGERRTRALRDLAARAGKAQTTKEALTLAAQTLSEFDLDIPFALFYLLDSTGKHAQLVAETCVLPPSIAIPLVDLQATQTSPWPLVEVAHSNCAIQIENLADRCGTFSCGPYPETPKTALVLPITAPGSENPTVIFIAGVSSRLPLTDVYRAFYELVAVAVTSAVANARAYEEERKRAEALAEIDRAKTAFFSNVSHEFRTPLTLMLGPLEDELAERSKPLSGGRRERLETAHRNTLRLLKLVNTLLDFSRIEAGRIQASYEPVDLSAYTAELASVFRSAIEKGGLTLTVDCARLPEPIYVDKDMWEKIVLNLLSNAFKHTFNGGIRVALKWCDDRVEFTVTDSGVGIPQAELPHLFDRFHRVKGAKSRTHEGTGIGLSLVRELIYAHGGIVSVKSEEGHGSVFTVVVKTGSAHLQAEHLRTPRTQASTVARAAAYVGEALQWVSEMPVTSELPALATGHLNLEDKPASVNSPRFRILWVDDNADMRDYVGRLLAERYEVTTVADGIAALAAALAAPPDLVLTDIMMPGLDGFGLLRELRANERTRTVPIILLSARAGEESSIEGIQAGADDYLAKPFSARELLARVQTHLNLSKLRREFAAELELRVEERTAELKQTEQELRAVNALREAMARSQAHLAAIVESSDDGIVSKDLNGIVTSWNAGAQRLFGYSSGEMMGQSIVKLIPPDRIDEGAAIMQSIRGGHHVPHVETMRRTKDGRLIHVSVTVSPVKDNSGCVVGASKVVRDISERKRAELAFKATSEDLARSNAELEQFAYSASHDLREPLRAVAGCVQLLRKRYGEQLDARADEYIEHAVDGAKRMQQLIDDLLAYSRVGAHQVAVQRIDCNDVLRRAQDNLQAAIDESGTVIESESLPQLTGDRTQLTLLLQNLLGNAIKFRRDEPPVIRIRCEQRGGEFVFAVSDNGIGIEERHFKRIFGVFQRLHTRVDYAGTGIGLALCAKIVAAHRGRLWLESQPGIGSTFFFALPVPLGVTVHE